MDELALFTEDQLSADKSRYLHIVYEGRSVEWGPEELFRADCYDTFFGVSYVSSAGFFSRLVCPFQRVIFLFGIPESELANAFASRVREFINVEQRIEFWNGLDETFREAVQSRRFDIRFIPPFGKPPLAVHSKFYLLIDEKSQNKRLIIGSANLTEKAFLGRGQFEELLVFDNADWIALYENRFRELLKKSVDYIPDEIRKKDVRQLIYPDAETLKNVLIENAEKIRNIVVLDEEETEQIKTLPIEISYQKEEADRTKEIIEILTQKKNNKRILHPPEQIVKKSVAIKTAICKTNKRSADSDSRIFFHYMDRNDMLYRGQPGSGSELTLLSKQASTDEIRQSLAVINDFISAYGMYTIHPDTRNQSKIFEILLFAFMSPYIWKIRDDYALIEGRGSVRASFQPFLIIAGKAYSGKTTALEFISMLIGGNPSERFLPYPHVERSGVIFDYFHTENVFPILVDEVPINFFRSTDTKKGENLIKHVSNDISGKHPVFICTTNLSEFNVSSQILRRVYYLEIDKVFDKAKQIESNRYLNDLLPRVTKDLFMDFSRRIGGKIQQKESFYETDDLLAAGRNIFKNYYQLAGMTLPEWFAEKPFNDYEERGRRIWKKQFIIHPAHFKSQDDGSIFVEESIFTDRRQRDIYLNFLRPDCVIEQNVILVLGKKEFYHFIQMDEQLFPPVNPEERNRLENELREEIAGEIKRDEQFKQMQTQLADMEKQLRLMRDSDQSKISLFQRLFRWFR